MVPMKKTQESLSKPVKNDNCSLVYRERPFCCICRKTNNIRDHATMAIDISVQRRRVIRFPRRLEHISSITQLIKEERIRIEIIQEQFS